MGRLSRKDQQRVACGLLLGIIWHKGRHLFNQDNFWLSTTKSFWLYSTPGNTLNSQRAMRVVQQTLPDKKWSCMCNVHLACCPAKLHEKFVTPLKGPVKCVTEVCWFHVLTLHARMPVVQLQLRAVCIVIWTCILELLEVTCSMSDININKYVTGWLA